jgi:hypothetical protein
VKVCSQCGEENPDRFRLCGYCGTPFAVSEPLQEVRKTVTVVFSDLVVPAKAGNVLSLSPENLRKDCRPGV